ncbi:MAG: beta-glucuronidase, partial [Lentisphaeria bacterium]|nr:beta-glucuronidase [Lentisphaeria bacterium]
CQIIPDFDGDAFVFVPLFHAVELEQRLRISVLADGKVAGAATVAAADGVPVRVALDEVRHWSPAGPFLYDVRYETLDGSGAVIDVVQSYAGLRKVQVQGDRVFLNNEPLYFRFVLDQGFYPDGIWTAPTDAALRRDIELSMKAGFNGARLHQKVFEERFHYWADQLGYLTWGESASWGCNVNRLEDARNFLSEWREIVVRDRNKPSIIAWTPFNETREVSAPAQHHRLHIDAYELSKALDPTRPVNDTSGYIHVRTDLWTVHHYERADKLGAFLQPAESADGVFHRWPELEASYQGQPYINDEFGGLKWIPKDRRAFADNTWGYGNDLESIEQFYELLEAEIDVMLAIPNLSGWCYTQLTDIEQEQNGVYNYDRTGKFDLDRLAAIFRKEL